MLLLARISRACRVTVGAFAVLVAFMGTGTAFAHASLTQANIKNGAVFHAKNAPKTLRATFAENLDPKQSWINVFDGKGDHGLVNEKSHSVVNYKNPKQMTLRLPVLPPNAYYFVWYTRSEDDGHVAAGVVYFTVVK